jgi:hypothetical protein
LDHECGNNREDACNRGIPDCGDQKEIERAAHEIRLPGQRGLRSYPVQNTGGKRFGALRNRGISTKPIKKLIGALNSPIFKRTFLAQPQVIAKLVRFPC